MHDDDVPLLKAGTHQMLYFEAMQKVGLWPSLGGLEVLSPTKAVNWYRSCAKLPSTSAGRRIPPGTGDARSSPRWTT